MKQNLEDLISVMKGKGFLTSLKVEQAIRDTPRHFFVPKESSGDAYLDTPISTKDLQTISQPSVVARMTEWLDVKKDSKILEVGAGSGWQSAILSRLVETTVYAVEKNKNLAEFAQENHKKLNIKNSKIIYGDGTLGLPEESPFDRIIITAACDEVPPPLIEQLAENGMLVAPVGKGVQEMIVLEKTPNGITERRREPGYVFVPLRGKIGK